MKRRMRSAFTLVELLIVVAIIAVLISILLPAINRARAAANLVACGSNVRSIVQATLTYCQEHKFAPPLRDKTPSLLTNYGVGDTIVTGNFAKLQPTYLNKEVTLDPAGPQKDYANGNSYYTFLPFPGVPDEATSKDSSYYPTVDPSPVTVPFLYPKLNAAPPDRAWVIDGVRAQANVFHLNLKSGEATFNLGFPDASVRPAVSKMVYTQLKANDAKPWSRLLNYVYILESIAIGRDYHKPGLSDTALITTKNNFHNPLDEKNWVR